jgi:hypothetical protein
MLLEVVNLEGSKLVLLERLDELMKVQEKTMGNCKIVFNDPLKNNLNLKFLGFGWSIHYSQKQRCSPRALEL